MKVSMNENFMTWWKILEWIQIAKDLDVILIDQANGVRLTTFP
jgi:hypothetical protein